MNKNIIIGIVIVVLLVLGGWFLWSQNSQAPVVDNTNQQTNTQPTDNNDNNGIDVDVDVSIPKTHEVIYSDTGYSPTTLTIKKGDTVTFKNNSSAGVWTGSAMHPTHTVYNGTTVAQHCPDTDNNDFDQCKSEGPGTSWSFTFNKTGEWGYHNHVNAKFFGKITVTE